VLDSILRRASVPQGGPAHPEDHECGHHIDDQGHQEDGRNNRGLAHRQENSVHANQELHHCQKIKEIAIIVGPGGGVD